MRLVTFYDQELTKYQLTKTSHTIKTSDLRSEFNQLAIGVSTWFEYEDSTVKQDERFN